MENEKKFFNALLVAFPPPARKIELLFNQEKSFKKVFDSLCRNSDLKELKNVDPEKEWQKLIDSEIKITLPSETDFPESLKNISRPPLGLYYKGKLSDKDRLKIAVVGTRKAGRYGKDLAFNFSKKLAMAGFDIISGLALGIDAQAHLGSLEAGGYTAAFLGSGLKRITPESNRKIGERIIKESGAVISEYPIESPAEPWHFPLRNRLVSGISRAILVIEAPADSGSLITAEFGRKQGKKVFVVPGDIYSQNFVGSNELIRQGSILVTKVEDIFKEFGGTESKTFSQVNLLSEKEKVIYKLIESGIGETEGILNGSGFSNGETLWLISALETRKIIKNIGGKFILNNHI